jgi:hypothetical protein
VLEREESVRTNIDCEREEKEREEREREVREREEQRGEGERAGSEREEQRRAVRSREEKRGDREESRAYIHRYRERGAQCGSVHGLLLPLAQRPHLPHMHTHRLTYVKGKYCSTLSLSFVFVSGLRVYAVGAL